MLSLWFALPVAAILVALGLHVVVLKGLRAGYRNQQSDRFTEDKEQAAPGQSLLGKIDLEAIELKAHRICLSIQPIFLAAIIIIYYRYHLKLDLQYLVTSIVACGLVFLYCLWNMLRGRRALKRYRLDYEAEVEVGGVARKASVMLTPEVKVGDYVLLHTGYAISVVDEEEAKETLDLFRQIAEAEQ